ncbi:hypothetical protein [Spirosoma pollinicola]|uniref:Uncharacterized protein n=1 Tax=Spirosoma pollinicola TaxID=2057025 RepID=A0A2K8ZAY8_9BACT|nr:hypothetical protein [Spirosoma pollinicola]AUD07042.1 hypothetical protein CWM47_37630 [Spirosoma pollinicola]
MKPLKIYSLERKLVAFGLWMDADFINFFDEYGNYSAYGVTTGKGLLDIYNIDGDWIKYGIGNLDGLLDIYTLDGTYVFYGLPWLTPKQAIKRTGL